MSASRRLRPGISQAASGGGSRSGKNNPPMTHAVRRPPTWTIVLAFALVYTSWGTTYLAIREGVQYLPPALFGGVRILLAGAVLFALLAWSGQQILVPWRELLWMALVGVSLFVGGNGLITVGEMTVESGSASVLAATTPLWLALMEMLWPGGERLTLGGWLGLFAGLAGVLVMTLQSIEELTKDVGFLFVLGSAFCWGLGSFLLRRRRPHVSPWTAAAYQMLLGGGAMTLLGLCLGEARSLTPDRFTPTAIFCFFYLLLVGSLIGFMAFTFLLNHVSAAMASTYSYVNPVVAVMIGCAAGEPLRVQVVAGMGMILLGVGLVRFGAVRART